MAPPLVLILELRRNIERLAKVLLVEPPGFIAGNLTIETFDDKDPQSLVLMDE
jgi:hypothetical protein